MEKDKASFFLFFNEKKNVMTISHEPSEDKDDILIFQMHGNNKVQMEMAAMLSITVFELGRKTKGKGKAVVSNEVGILYLEDANHPEILKLKAELSALTN